MGVFYFHMTQIQITTFWIDLTVMTWDDACMTFDVSQFCAYRYLEYSMLSLQPTLEWPNSHILLTFCVVLKII